MPKHFRWLYYLILFINIYYLIFSYFLRYSKTFFTYLAVTKMTHQNKQCSVGINLNEDCNAVTVRNNWNLSVIQINTYYFSKPVAHLPMRTPFVIIVKRLYMCHNLKTFNNIVAVIHENSTISKLKSTSESVMAKLLKS